MVIPGVTLLFPMSCLSFKNSALASWFALFSCNKTNVKVPNLVSRVRRLFGQQLVARRDSGELEFYYRRIFAGKRYKLFRDSQSKNLSFQFPEYEIEQTQVRILELFVL